MAANCGVRKACATVNSRSAALAVAAAARGNAGGLRTSNAVGIIRSQQRAPNTNIAERQPYSVISQRASGDIVIAPTAKPDEIRATARLRCRVNQRVADAVSGA